MRYVKLGRTGLDVSPVAIGTMTIGEPERGYPTWSLPEQESRLLIKRALDAGINFFDTANMYSAGSSEEILGRALRDYADRDEIVIATKLRARMRPGPNGAGLSRKAIMTEVEHSLRRLGTDYLDLYQIHRLDHGTPLEETLEALHDLVKAGKVRYLGASTMYAYQFAKALHTQWHHGWARFATMQNLYNPLAREQEREMLPLCADEGVGVIAYSPLARGRLARPWDATATARSAIDGSSADMYYPATDADSNHAIIDAVGRIAENRGVSRAQVALAWVRSQPAVVAPLAGISSARHVDDAVASVDLELTEEELRAVASPYTPRREFPPVSDEAELRELMRNTPGFESLTASS